MSNSIQLLTPVDFSGGTCGKEPTYQCRRQKILARSLSGEDALEEGMATQSRILALESLGQRSLAGYSPQGRTESDTSEAT